MSGYKVVPVEPTVEMVEPAVQGEPAAWLTLCIKGDQKGQVEIDEPHGKATNPEYWTDAFAVYKTLKHAEQQPAPDVAGLMGVLGQYFDAMDSIGREGTATSTLIAEAECDEAEARLRLFLAAHRKGGDV